MSTEERHTKQAIYNVRHTGTLPLNVGKTLLICLDVTSCFNEWCDIKHDGGTGCSCDYQEVRVISANRERWEADA